MKPFDLEQAKAGKPLVTRGGRDAKFIAYDTDIHDDEALIWLDIKLRTVHMSDKNGRYLPANGPNDLFMKTVKKTVYVNLWINNGILYCTKKPWATKEGAFWQTEPTVINWVAKAVPIEIEE